MLCVVMFLCYLFRKNAVTIFYMDLVLHFLIHAHDEFSLSNISFSWSLCLGQSLLSLSLATIDLYD